MKYLIALVGLLMTVSIAQAACSGGGQYRGGGCAIGNGSPFVVAEAQKSKTTSSNDAVLP